MYDHRLDHFVAAVEEGSFSAAARRLYITPSAVIQQVNLLEGELGAKLLNRTHSGVTPTAAGEYLYGAVKPYIARAEEIRARVAEIEGASAPCIVVGTNPYHRADRIYELWFRYETTLRETNRPVPQLAIDEIKATTELPGIDILEGALFEVPWQGGFDFMRLAKDSLVIAVSTRHPLYGRRFAAISDFACRPVITIREGMAPAADAATADLSAAGVQIERVDIYDSSTIGRCITEGVGLLVPASWAHISPKLECVALDWPYAAEYGFHVSKSASPAAREFAQFVSESTEAWAAQAPRREATA